MRKHIDRRHKLMTLLLIETRFLIFAIQNLFRLKNIQLGHQFIELSKELSQHHLNNISLHGVMLECPIVD